VVAAAQAVSHTVLTTGAPHGHHVGTDSTSLLGGGSPWSWQMLLAHAVATVAAAVVWRWCERAAEVVLVRRAVWVPVPTGVEKSLVTHLIGGTGVLVWLMSAPRRGPPAAVRTGS
jgi:hypothetical protein